MLNEDLVYYLIVNGEFRHDLCFASEEEAVEYAVENEFLKYEVYEWNVE